MKCQREFPLVPYPLPGLNEGYQDKAGRWVGLHHLEAKASRAEATLASETANITPQIQDHDSKHARKSEYCCKQRARYGPKKSATEWVQGRMIDYLHVTWIQAVPVLGPRLGFSLRFYSIVAGESGEPPQ